MDALERSGDGLMGSEFSDQALQGQGVQQAQATGHGTVTAVPTDARFTAAPELSVEEAATLARFALADPAPESYVVRQFAREFAAEEMRAVAHRLDDNGDEAVEVALGGSVYVHRVLCDTAHALDGKP
jgi:hypothetical protein